MAHHVHITDNGEIIGTLFLDDRGHVADDGSKAAKNAMDHTNHGHRRDHGEAALNAIVAHFDGSTLVGAYHCDDAHRQAATKAVIPAPEDEEGYSDDRRSTEPTPQDPWPAFGELSPDQQYHPIQFGDDKEM